MATTINFVEGDGQPIITATLTDATGAAIDLTGTTPKLTVRNRLGQVAIMNQLVMTVSNQSTNKGQCTYTVNPAVDDVTPGFYLMQVYVPDLPGGGETFPNEAGAELLVEIGERL